MNSNIAQYFYFAAGILLIVLFLWYLASENDKVKRNAGIAFILGLASFTIFSLCVYGLHYGIDISGGTELTLRVQPKEGETKPTEQEMQQACDILNERLNASGTSEVQILHSEDKILIQIPQQDRDPKVNKEKMDAMQSMLTKMAKLELRAVDPRSDEKLAREQSVAAIEQYTAKYYQYLKDDAAYRDRVARSYKGEDVEVGRAPVAPKLPPVLGSDYKIYPHPLMGEEDGKPVLNSEGMPILNFIVLQSETAASRDEVNITGKDVVRANPDYGHRGVVSVTLSSAGAERMRRLTGKMQIGSDRMAVVLNGTVKCAPTVQAVLGKDFQISGLNAPGEPEDISKALSNPLANDLVVEGRKDVSAQLGQTALEQGFYAGIVGLIGIFIFCYWYYRIAGVVAMVGLTFNALILLGLMSLFGFVLTLPGIAGIVLTMGMAVDANVLIYERMREERKQGRPFLVCLRNAYDKAFSAIWDSNITSLITAVILFWLASGSIKGFAVTTSVGIVTSLIGAVVVTRVLFFCAEHWGFLKNFEFGTPPLYGKAFDFMKMGRKTGLASIIVITLCIGYMFGIRGEKALGVDFTGGASITYTIPKDVEVDYSLVEKIVDNEDGALPLTKKATAQEFTDPNGHNIKIRCASEEDAKLIDDAIQKDVPHMADVKDPDVEKVSSALGATFFQTACWALLAGMVGISIYLALRFEWSFAMAALISIFHDVAATIGIVVLMGTELNIIHVGAFLTVAGYSINDTIVIFDRIRESLRTAEPGEPLKNVFNEAINSTLSRTLLTSISTLAVLVALILLGGPAMRDFSVCMVIGIFVGTYSSIYIAAPVVLFFSRKGDLQKEIQQIAEADSSV